MTHRDSVSAGLRSSTHAIRREGLARDLLHDRDGALADERDRHWLGAHAVSYGADGGIPGSEADWL